MSILETRDERESVIYKPVFTEVRRVNSQEAFLRVRNETESGRIAQLEFESGKRRYIRRFIPKERLILLGGGHIAVPVCEIASLLGFLVTVVDDRPSFANHERFPHSETVICDSFENAIERLHITSSDYVCVLTRGHRWDAECLRRILRGAYPFYLGMIGSRRRVSALLELLREEGYEEEKLSAVYTPIGLKINAQTPEEIAVSICAQIIQLKRSQVQSEDEGILKRTDTDEELLRFLAENDTPTVCMVVISTKGSTPVQSGAMMAVDRAGRTRGTIGGGCGEAQALAAARGLAGCGESRLVRVDMTNDVAMEEGMVCGGTMDVLISDIPLR